MSRIYATLLIWKKAPPGQNPIIYSKFHTSMNKAWRCLLVENLPFWDNFPPPIQYIEFQPKNPLSVKKDFLGRRVLHDCSTFSLQMIEQRIRERKRPNL